jgi:hypothetical protein
MRFWRNTAPRAGVKRSVKTAGVQRIDFMGVQPPHSRLSGQRARATIAIELHEPSADKDILVIDRGDDTRGGLWIGRAAHDHETRRTGPNEIDVAKSFGMPQVRKVLAEKSVLVDASEGLARSSYAGPATLAGPRPHRRDAQRPTTSASLQVARADRRRAQCGSCSPASTCCSSSQIESMPQADAAAQYSLRSRNSVNPPGFL